MIKQQIRQVWPPEPGLFAMRLVRNGWRVPARILHTDDGCWQAEVDGELLEADPDPAHAKMVAAIWHSALRADEATFDWLVATREWARTEAPDHPSLHPRKPIDPRRLSPIPPRHPSPNPTTTPQRTNP